MQIDSFFPHPQLKIHNMSQGISTLLSQAMGIAAAAHFDALMPLLHQWANVNDEETRRHAANFQVEVAKATWPYTQMLKAVDLDHPVKSTNPC